ncbi:MAG: hypothetical protein ACD_63C00165G0001, partial [uncultured bacterium]
GEQAQACPPNLSGEQARVCSPNNKNMDLLILNMSSWNNWQKYVNAKSQKPLIFQQTGVVNRNYHILQQLLKRREFEKILSVDLLPLTRKRTVRVFYESIIGKIRGENVTAEFYVSGLHSKVVKVKPNMYVYATARNLTQGKGSEAIWTEISSILEFAKFKDIMLWSYNPMFTKPFEELKNATKIFDAVDDWREHAFYKRFGKILNKNYKIIDEKASAIFTVSKELLKSFPKNKNKQWISNGIDIKHYLSSNPKNSRLKNKFLKIKKPIIGYLGIIESRVDFKLLKYVLDNVKNISLVMAGPVWKQAETKYLKGYKNAHYLGPISYKDLPYLFSQFDVGIIPHKITKFTKSMNPLKMYEYLACGIPVVTAPVSGTEQFKGLVQVADTQKQFADEIKKALKNSSKKLEEKRKKSVKPYSWESRVDKMMSKI